jgi:DNA processing protein
MDSLVCAVALRSIDGIGDILFKRLIEAFGSAEKALAASPEKLQEVEGIGARVARSIVARRDFGPARKVIERAEEIGATLISLEEEAYPPLLRAIADPPSFLYVLGELLQQDRRCVAIVGSRRASSYGRSITERLAAGLSREGFTVVSGGARGIDTFAHRAALEAGGRTLVVLGSGVDVPYPAEHENLFKEISERGAVLSELPPGTPPEPHRFPKRNRIISGLSMGTVVVEAAGESGSLITATLAAEQGREVFSVPGNVGSYNSVGTHKLIRQGAKLTEGIEDILEELIPQIGKRRVVAPPPSFEGEEEKLYSLLSVEPKHIDRLAEESRFLPQKVMGLLLQLELKGAVRQMPGQLYVRI